MNDHPSGPEARAIISRLALELQQAQLDDMMTNTIINMIVRLPRNNATAFTILETVILGVVMSITKSGKEDELIDGLAGEVKNKIAQIKTVLAAASTDKTEN